MKSTQKCEWKVSSAWTVMLQVTRVSCTRFSVFPESKWSEVKKKLWIVELKIQVLCFCSMLYATEFSNIWFEVKVVFKFFRICTWFFIFCVKISKTNMVTQHRNEHKKVLYRRFYLTQWLVIEISFRLK